MASEEIGRSGIPPDNFTGWVVEPMPFDGDRDKCGARATFCEYTFDGSPTVVGRIRHDARQDGCVAFTKHPLSVNKAWRVTLRKTTDKWRRGLVSLYIVQKNISNTCRVAFLPRCDVRSVVSFVVTTRAVPISCCVYVLATSPSKSMQL